MHYMWPRNICWSCRFEFCSVLRGKLEFWYFILNIVLLGQEALTKVKNGKPAVSTSIPQEVVEKRSRKDKLADSWFEKLVERPLVYRELSRRSVLMGHAWSYRRNSDVYQTIIWIYNVLRSLTNCSETTKFNLSWALILTSLFQIRFVINCGLLQTMICGTIMNSFKKVQESMPWSNNPTHRTDRSLRAWNKLKTPYNVKFIMCVTGHVGDIPDAWWTSTRGWWIWDPKTRLDRCSSMPLVLPVNLTHYTGSQGHLWGRCP